MDRVGTTDHRLRAGSALIRLLISAVLGMTITAILAATTDIDPRLYGWAITAALYVAWTWLVLGRMNAAATEWHASRDDPTHLATLLIVVACALASLTAIGAVLFEHSSRSFLLGTVAAIVVSWAAIHTVFAAHYAREYFSGEAGGIDFHQKDPPCYSDFAYVAFTVGMSFAISDTDLSGTRMRRAALPHALLSYLFGTVIVAMVINIVAGLAH